MKALIVSRTPGARAWIRAALGADWQVDEAENGLVALKLASEDAEVDLVVTDQSAEPYGAFGLCREIKLLEVPPGVIILLERAQDSWLATWAGADRWLVQPVDPFALARAAADVVDSLDAAAEPVAEPTSLS